MNTFNAYVFAFIVLAKVYGTYHVNHTQKLVMLWSYIFLSINTIFSDPDVTPGTSQAVQESGVFAYTEEPCKH